MQPWWRLEVESVSSLSIVMREWKLTLLAWGFATGGLAGGLLGTSHVDEVRLGDLDW